MVSLHSLVTPPSTLIRCSLCLETLPSPTLTTRQTPKLTLGMTLSALLSEYPLALLLQGRDTGYFLGLESLPSPFPRANHALLCASDGKPNCFQPKTGNVGAREKKSKCV